ncbi:nuclear transport factor 2 family protein [Halobaculum marinum]|uniref:Nuclear transport factor 2 family protein n=1 Tax=Halobaculum marinum TaxID=3031996 RepID=A0ABD5WW95_9EURY|nr:nuclear transport factor 2 family protein [Halobaculum sp. DT55]
MTHTATARAYYRAIDDGEYDALADLLAPEFVHERPDRTISGRASFVSFMRERRPRTDTEHSVDAMYAPVAGPASEAVARGRLRGSDGEDLFGFVDVFAFASAEPDASIDRLTTYTR